MAPTNLLTENIKLSIDVVILERKNERLEKEIASYKKDLSDLREYACRMNDKNTSLYRDIQRLLRINTSLQFNIAALKRQQEIKINHIPEFYC